MQAEVKKAKPSQTSEAGIVATILRRLRTIKHSRWEKTHGGPFGNAGKPDITGCIDGTRIEIEVKRPGEKPTEIQKQTIAEWQMAGAVAFWATSWPEVEQRLRDEKLI